MQPKRKRYRTKRIIALENQLQQKINEGFDPSTSSAAAQLFLLSQLPSTSEDFDSISTVDLTNKINFDSEILREENCTSHESQQSNESLDDNINGNSNNTTTTSSSASPFNINDLQNLTNTNNALFNNYFNTLSNEFNNFDDSDVNKKVNIFFFKYNFCNLNFNTDFGRIIKTVNI